MRNELYTLAYHSRAARDVDKAALSTLLLKAQRFNESVGVTGLLIYANGRFLQTLEGTDAGIDQAYARIERDPQHTDIVVFCRDPIVTRVYPTWAMMSSIETASTTIATFLKGRLEKPAAEVTASQRDAIAQSLEFIETNGQIRTRVSVWPTAK